MSTDLDQVRLRMVAADPAPPGAEPPAGVMTADVLLDLIDERSGVMPNSTDTLEHRTDLEPPRHRWSPGWAFAGAFVLLIAAAGLAMGLVGSRSGDVVDQPTPTTMSTSTTVAETSAETTAGPATTAAAAASPTTTTIPKVIPADITWELVMPTGVDGIQFGGILSDGASVVALGQAFAGEGWADARPEVWRSEDGLTWEPFVGGAGLLDGIAVVGSNGFTTLTIEDSAVDYGLQWISYAVRGEPGWIAWGGWELDGRIWISPDGESWEGVDQTPFTGVRLNDVVAGGPGYVAVGDGSEGAVAFVSSTGRDWQLVDVFAERESSLGSIEVDPTDGSLLAFGNRAVWRSRDGYDRTAIHQRSALTWLSQPPPGAHAVWVGDTIVAAGGDRAFSLWYSYDDGASWLRHDPDDPVFDLDVNISGLIEHQGRLIAVGQCARCTFNLPPTETPTVDPEWGVIWVGTPN